MTPRRTIGSTFADAHDPIWGEPIFAIWLVFNVYSVFLYVSGEQENTTIHIITFLARLSARWHAHPPSEPRKVQPVS
jgi:hypothetical protein